MDPNARLLQEAQQTVPGCSVMPLVTRLRINRHLLVIALTGVIVGVCLYFAVGNGYGSANRVRIIVPDGSSGFLWFVKRNDALLSGSECQFTVPPTGIVEVRKLPFVSWTHLTMSDSTGAEITQVPLSVVRDFERNTTRVFVMCGSKNDRIVVFVGPAFELCDLTRVDSHRVFDVRPGLLDAQASQSP